VAIAACRAFGEAEATDIYPDPDWSLLAAALGDAGVDATSISWDQENVDWQRFEPLNMLPALSQCSCPPGGPP